MGRPHCVVQNQRNPSPDVIDLKDPFVESGRAVISG